MSADIRPNWVEAGIGRQGRTSLYLAKVKPLENHNPEVTGVIFCDRETPGRLAIPVATKWMRSDTLSKQIVLDYLGSGSLNCVEMAVETVLGQRNKAIFTQQGIGQNSMFLLGTEGTERNGYHIYSSFGSGADPHSQIFFFNFSGDNIKLADFWEDGIKALITNALSMGFTSVHAIDGYARRMHERLGLFSLEPVNYQDWKREAQDSLKG